MKTYKYVDDTNRVIHIIDEDGVSRSSCLVEVIADWIAEGNTPLPYDISLSDKITEINKYFSGVINAGFNYNGFKYQCDIFAQGEVAKRATYAGWSKLDTVTFPWNDPYSRGWWDTSNQWHTMTAIEFCAFAKAMSDYCSTCAAVARDHKNSVTVENYLTYDYTIGWPVN